MMADIQAQLQLIERGTVDIISREELARKLERARRGYPGSSILYFREL